jgi:hypothetical protein
VLDRLSRTQDGRIAYERKYKSEGAPHVVMTPNELLGRLASLEAAYDESSVRTLLTQVAAFGRRSGSQERGARAQPRGIGANEVVSAIFAGYGS